MENKELALVRAALAKLEEAMKELLTAKNTIEWQMTELETMKSYLVKLLPMDDQFNRLFH